MKQRERGKVLYIGGFELPDRNAAAHRVLANAKIFRDLGYRVVLAGTSRDETKAALAPGACEGFDRYDQAYPKTLKQWTAYASSIAWITELMDELGEVSLVVAYNYPALALRRLQRYCHARGIAIWGDCSEWYAPSGDSSIRRLLKWADTAYRMRRVHRQLDCLIVISSYLARYYQDVPVVLLPPLVDKGDKKWAAAHKWPADEGVLRLIYAGSPHNKDKLEALCTAVTLSQGQATLEVVGITQEQYAQMSPYAQASLQGVLFHGRLSHLDTLELIKQADASVVLRDASRVTSAGFPTKVVEAISCGVPVLTNITSDLGDYIDGLVNGVVVSEVSPGAILDALEFFRQNRERILVEEDRFDYRHYLDQVSIQLSLLEGGQHIG